jgi:H+/Cl- antiporter ClcA
VEHWPGLFTVLKFVTSWLSAWAGVPGGVFAPSLSMGASLGVDVAWLTHSPHVQALIALGMAAFLAAVTQTPITAMIIVMEMTDGHGMVLSLMAVALLASLVSRMVSRPLYSTLCHLLVQAHLPRADEAPPGPGKA